MRGTLYRLVWQTTLPDCLKYQKGHSSTLGHIHSDIVLLSLPRLASPRLTNNSCQQWDAMSALRSGADVPLCLFALIVPLCVNVALRKRGKVRTLSLGISWKHYIYVWMFWVYQCCGFKHMLWYICVLRGMLIAVDVFSARVMARLEMH